MRPNPADDGPRLTRYQRTGFDCKWWLYDDEFADIAAVLQEAFLCHWSAAVQDVLTLNERAGAARPRNWSQLGRAIRRHEKQVPKYKKQFVPPWLVRYKIASVLGVEEHRLAPSRAELIGTAATILVENEFPDTDISAHLFPHYASYVLAADYTHEIGWPLDRIRALVSTAPGGGGAGADVLAAARVAEALGALFHTRPKFDRLVSEFTLRFAGGKHGS